MTLEPGTRLGGYEIVDRIGAGGMGEVFRARDLELGREVAIKVLPDRFDRDEDLLARFDREARVLASLNHPNIATLHGLERHGDVRCLVMELVEGEDLRERLERGALSSEEAIALFAQIADGLCAAHDRGIVHRDLKPANIKITAEGRAKILDFGLAKALELDSGEDPRESQTMTAGATELGAVLGTGPYMSPEQAMGRPVDRQTDVWAFGCCLFEALSGRRAFGGETLPEILVSIKTEEPHWDALSSSIPRRLHRLLHRCLQKSPRDRLRDLGDARLELAEIRDAARSSPDEGSPAAGRGKARPGSSRILKAAASVVVLALVAVGLVDFLRGRDESNEAATAAGGRIVVLMDTAAPAGVYDEETRGSGGTNADDLNHELSDLPLVLHKETLSSTWDREDQLLKQSPALILIHRSAFFHSANLELGLGYGPFEDPWRQELYDRLYGYFDDKLAAMLGHIGTHRDETRFLLYSRGFVGESGAAWNDEIVRRFPTLEGRITTFDVPVGPDGASFRDPETARLVREQVTRLLALDKRASAGDGGP